MKNLTNQIDIDEEVINVLKDNNILEYMDEEFFKNKEDYVIVVDDTVHDFTYKALKFLGEIHYIDTTKMSDSLLEKTDILIIRTKTKANKDLIDKAKRLKIIATATTGLDHIDIDYATQKGIKIIGAKGENADAVADYILRMIIHSTDDITYANNLLKETAEFNKIKKDNKRTELSSKTLGIIGYGNVGQKVAKRALGFGMKVKAYDPYIKEAKDSFDDALGCDIITLHPELTPETEGMIDKESFNKMKKNAIFINASRGEIVVEADLIDALEKGIIKLAILDVFENEPRYTKLYELKNTIVTPHIAGNTHEAKVNASRKIVVEIIKHLKILTISS